MMKSELIRITDGLLRTLPNVAEVNHKELFLWYEKNNIPKVISLMKNQMGVRCRIYVKSINDFGPEEIFNGRKAHRKAHVFVPEIFPADYLQKNLTVEMHLFEKQIVNFSSFVKTISHELAHLILYGMHHNLRHSEEATDIAAIVLGYGLYYFQSITPILGGRADQSSYLTPDEIKYVIGRVLKERKFYPIGSHSKNNVQKDLKSFESMLENVRNQIGKLFK